MVHLHAKDLDHVGGKNTLFYRFAEKFFMPGANQMAREVCRSCLRCQKVSKRPAKFNPPMASLPPYRIPADRFLEPFLDIGIDLCGPFTVKIGRSDPKVWILVVACTVTRAVQLHLLMDQGTPELILALRAHIARTRRPRLILCDNGKNLIGAFNELTSYQREALASGKWSEESLRLWFPRIQWRFIPPKASHFGGHYERIVGVVKTAFRNLAPKYKEDLTVSQWHTLLAEAESLINSRPLAAVSTDPRDPLPIRPCDFLLTGAFQSFAPLERYANPTERVRFMQDAIENFQAKLVQELRPALHKTCKWYGKDSTPIKIGDVVGLLEANALAKWPLAQVVELHPGKDGVVRQVSVVSDYFKRGEDNELKPFKRGVRDLIRLFDDEYSL